MKLAESAVIVTGASSGIGAALSRALLAAGARVVLAARSVDKLQAVLSSSQNSHNGLVVGADVSTLAGLQTLVSETERHFGAIDIVVNCAGMTYGGHLVELSPAEIEYQLRVDLLGPILLTRLALPLLSARPRSLIVNIASLSAMVAVPYQSVYVASKHGLRGFGRALRRDLHGTNTKVLNVYPGMVMTEAFTQEVLAQAKGLTENALDVTRVAHRILRAIEKEERELVIANAQERFAPVMEHWMPGLVTLMFSKLGHRVLAMMRATASSARQRHAVGIPNRPIDAVSERSAASNASQARA